MTKIKISINHTLANNSVYLVWANSSQVDVNPSAPGVRHCSVLGKRAQGMLAPSSVMAECLRQQAFKVLILQGMTQFVSHFQNLHFIQFPRENSCSLPEKTFYGRSFHSANFRQNFQFRVNARRKANTGSNIPSLTLYLKSLILTFLKTNSFHPNKSISICSLS